MALYPRLQRALAAGEPPVAARALEGIRRLVLLNLVLGVVIFVIMVTGRAF